MDINLGEIGESVISFRRFLSVEIADCVSCFKHAFLPADLLAEFILVHSRYQEEGSNLFPAVFLAEKVEDILSAAQGVDPIHIGTGAMTREGVQQVFKRCAPLASERTWAIFVVVGKGTLQFGVFRTDQFPLRPTAFENLRRLRDPSLSVIGLVRMGSGFVEVRSTRGWVRFVNLTREQEETANPRHVISTFIDVVSRDCPEHLCPELRSFYYRVASDILQADHGTLLVVVDHRRGIPKAFDDGVKILPRIEVVDGIEKLRAERSNEAYQRLGALSVLIRKMTGMDGITVVDSSGAIVGYNFFVRSAELDANALPQAGGARRRAFGALCSHLGEDLLTVIYKSRDGAVEIGTSKNALRG